VRSIYTNFFRTPIVYRFAKMGCQALPAIAIVNFLVVDLADHRVCRLLV
jgi:hypothetical protein